MKRIIKIMLAALLIAAIGGGGYFYFQSRAATGTDTASTGSYTQVVQVKQGDLSSTLSVVGQLEAEQSSLSGVRADERDYEPVDAGGPSRATS